MQPSKYYYRDQPCKNGHIGYWYIRNNSCVACLHEATNKWRLKNKEKVRKYEREYNQKNPEVKIRSEAKRRAIKLKSGGTFPKEDIDKLFQSQNGLCPACGVDLKSSGFHIDHRIPLSRGGSNWPENLQLLCPADNVRKSNLTDIEYFIKCVYSAQRV